MILGTMIMLAAIVQDVPPILPQPDGCFPVQDDRIYARDFAAAIPAFGNVPTDFVMGYAPAPGTRRVFNGAALKKLAMNQGVAIDAPPEVCFERAMATLESGEILDAMRSVFSA